MKVHMSNLLLLFTYFQVVNTKPIPTKNTKENYYQFWKVVYKKLIPQTQALQKLTNEAVDTMCSMDDLVNSLPENMDCSEYLETIAEKFPTAQKKSSQIYIKNTHKFMKILVKSTMKVLYQYIKPVEFISEDLENDNLCDDTAICDTLDIININYKQLTDKISTEMKEYFHIQRLSNSGKSIKYTRENITQQAAILYSLLNQLHEAEAALEFIVKSTWDVHVQKMANFESGRKSRRRRSRKPIDLKI